jgi:hypothetical protein
LTNELVVTIFLPEIQAGSEIVKAVHYLVFDARREDFIETEDVGCV